ncbi:MAG: ATP-binding protein [Acidobacteriota bacterium]
MSHLRKRLVRPLLGVPRAELERFTSRCGIEPIQDPTNLDLSTPRNYIRLALLPTLDALHPSLRQDVSRLAEISGSLYSICERAVRSRITLTRVGTDPAIARSQLEALPDALVPVALAVLHKSAGLPYPPRAAAVSDLLRQMRAGLRLGCDCGDQWRWQQRGRHVTLRRLQPPTSGFAYTLQVPGDCEVPEVSMRFRIRQGPIAAWMFRHSERRAALDLPLVAGHGVGPKPASRGSSDTSRMRILEKSQRRVYRQTSAPREAQPIASLVC